MTDEKFTEIIDRLARIEEKVNSTKNTLDKNVDLVSKHETDIQRAKGVLGFISIVTSIIAIKNFIK